MRLEPYVYKVVSVDKVVDGDTFYLTVDLGFHVYHRIKVRLQGVDAPEIFRPVNEAEKKAGLAARDFVERWLKQGRLIIKTYKDRTGKYGRYLADVYREGEDESLSHALKAHLEKYHLTKEEIRAQSGS